MALWKIYFFAVVAEIVAVTAALETTCENCTSQIKDQLLRLSNTRFTDRKVTLNVLENNGKCEFVVSMKDMALSNGAQACPMAINGETIYDVDFTISEVRFDCVAEIGASQSELLKAISNFVTTATHLANQQCPDAPASKNNINANGLLTVPQLNTDECTEAILKLPTEIVKSVVFDMTALAALGRRRAVPSHIIPPPNEQIIFGNELYKLQASAKLVIKNGQTTIVEISVKPLEYNVLMYCVMAKSDFENACECIYSSAIPKPLIRTLIANLLTCYANDDNLVDMREALTCV